MNTKTPKGIPSTGARVVTVGNRIDTTTTLATTTSTSTSAPMKNGLSKKTPKNRVRATQAGAAAVSGGEFVAVVDDAGGVTTTSPAHKSMNPAAGDPVHVPGLSQRRFPTEKFGGAYATSTVVPTTSPYTRHQASATNKGLRNNSHKIRASRAGVVPVSNGPSTTVVDSSGVASTTSNLLLQEKRCLAYPRRRQHRMTMKAVSRNTLTDDDDDDDHDHEASSVDDHDGGIVDAAANTTPGRIETPSSTMTSADNMDAEQPASPSLSNQDLVEAKVVPDENIDLEYAEELDPAILSRRASKEQQDKECHRIGFALLAFAIVTLLGVILGSCLRYASLVANKTAPTSVDPGAPLSLMKNQAPLYDELPETTRKSLYNPESPQHQAWEWLLNHPDLSTMEDWRRKQIFAMATLFYSFEGLNWPEHIRERWMDVNTSECSWVLTDAEAAYWAHQSDMHFGPDAYDHQDYQPCNKDGKIQTIILSQLYLPTNANPSIPPEVGLLTSLSILGIVISEINAKISDLLIPELIHLPNLSHLNLHGIDISGSIPKDVALLTGLRHLLICGNRLTGTIPPSVAKMSSLEYFSLTQMKGITGRLPSELGMLTRLTGLEVVGNSLNGPIPQELGSMTSIQKMWLGNNGLTGSVPGSLRMMANATALFLGNDSELKGSRNAFVGTLPQELWELSQLGTLFLANLPNLHGRIPTDTMMSNMVGLRLEGSPNLSGTIPEELCFLEKEPLASYTDVQGNALDFDCSDLLCGCDCACDNGSSGNVTNPNGWQQI